MLTAAAVPPMMLARTASGELVTTTNATGIADAYACVRCLSDVAGSLPLHVYRRAENGRVRVENGTSALLARPAPAVTTSNFTGHLVATLALHGEGFIAKWRDAAGSVAQLSLWPTERVEVELRPGGEPVYTLTDPEGRRTSHTTADVIHVKGMTLDGLRGVSPVRACRESFGVASAMTESTARFFANDATPRGILKVSGPPKTDGERTVDVIGQAWSTRHRGVANTGRIAVLSGDIEFQPVSMPLGDAQWIEQRKLSTAEIARIFRVPPWMIGAESGDSLTYSNVESQAQAFVTFSLRPWLVAVEQALNADQDLFHPRARSYCEFKVDGLLRGDSATRAAFYTAALNTDTGWMNRDEVRELENLPREAAA